MEFWNHIDIHRILVRFQTSSTQFRSFFFWVRIYSDRFLSCPGLSGKIVLDPFMYLDFGLVSVQFFFWVDFCLDFWVRVKCCPLPLDNYTDQQ